MRFGRYHLRWSLLTKLVAVSLGAMLSMPQGQAIAQTNNHAPLIAQTSTLAPVAAVGAGSARKNKKSIITDSLWGNLILEFAYEKDPVLRKLGTMSQLMNFATSLGVAGIAGGALFQGCYQAASLNPPDGHQDSYTPGITGIVLSATTLATMFSRQVAGHEIFGHIRKRQLVLKDKVESLLGRLEDSHCTDKVAEYELADLIGDQASGEWLQMWRGTHKLSTQARRIGVETTTPASLMAAASDSKGGM